MSKRITAEEALSHPFMQAGIVTTPRKISVYAPPLTPVEIQRPPTPPAEPKTKRDLRFLFRTAILSVRFMYRIKNLKKLKLSIDRTELRKRPFRNRDVIVCSLIFKQLKFLDSSRSRSSNVRRLRTLDQSWFPLFT